MAALDNIASELLKAANVADLNFKKTRDQAERDKAVRLRRIVENLRQLQIGDMLKSVYDTDDDGVVDASETVRIVVRNSTGSTLNKGSVVYLSGATGNRPNALLSQANAEATSSKTIGIVIANIPNNSDGYVAVGGTLHDLDTSAFAAGSSVWLSPTIAGGLTTTVPTEPNHSVFIGYIARSHPTQGRLVILIQNGYELNELHDVNVPTPSNGDLLQYDSANAYWKNVAASVAVPTPTLAQVTTAGNTTTNAITVGNVTINGTILTLNSTADHYATFTSSSIALDIQSFNNTPVRINNGGGGSVYLKGASTYISSGVLNIGTGTTDGMVISASSASNGKTIQSYGGHPLILNSLGNNVLIGTTTNAGYKLDVNGVTRIGSSYGTFIAGAATDWGYSITGGEAAVISAANIQGSTRTIYGVTIPAQSANLVLGSSYGYDWGMSFNIISTGKLGIKVNKSTDAALIFANGNWGIGTTTDAGYKLDVNGTARVQGVLTGTANINGLTVSNNNSNPVIGSDGTNVLIGSNQLYRVVFSSNRIDFKVSDGTNAVNAGSFTSSGSLYVGGNAATTAKLQVSGSVTASAALAQGVYFNNTLVAAANNDVLVGLQVAQTGSVGAFTGVVGYNLITGSLSGYNLRVHRIAYGANERLSLNGFNVNTANAPIYVQDASSGGTYIGGGGGEVQLGGGGGKIYTGSGNFLINTSTDAGYKLDVNGTAVIRGQLSVGATYLGLNFTGADCNIFNNGGSAGNISLSLGGNKYFNVFQVVGSSSGYTSGTHNTFTTPITYAWSSGTAVSNSFVLNPTINNTGTYSGMFRGLYYNPTLTSLTGTTHRAIETTSGDVIFNGGQVGIGTTSLYSDTKLKVKGVDSGLIFLVSGASYGVRIGANAVGGFISGVDQTGFGSDQALNFRATKYQFDLGNILIGTTTDTGEKLQVNGSIKSSALTLNGPVLATGGVLSSIAGYTGLFTVPTNPPGMQTLDIQNGIIVNVL